MQLCISKYISIKLNLKYLDTSNIILFRFPKSDNRRLWIHFCERHGVIEKNWNKAWVCHRHFTKEDYAAGCRVRLRLNSKAIPTIVSTFITWLKSQIFL